MVPWIVLAAEALGGPARMDIDAVLDDLHLAASEADSPRYFGHFTDDAVFIGTDATERWSLDTFRELTKERFDGESAWTYAPVERHVTVSAKGRTAWFDEQLDHARYGRVRGSGVLVKQGTTWKIAQYVLSFAIPNDIAMHVVRATKHEAFLPTPFTAAQIQAAMPVGTVLEHLRGAPDAAVRITWKVVEAGDVGCRIQYTTEGQAEPATRAHTWTELRDHAKFPTALTSVVDEAIDTPLGRLECRHYTVRTAAQADAAVAAEFWFCPDLPGPPVRLIAYKDGAIVQQMALASRVLP